MALLPEPRMVPLAQIRPDPTQSRTSFDAAEIEGLARNIAENGLLSPISLRQTGENSYELIAGERRYRALAFLKAETISSLVWPAETPALQTEIMSLSENLQRVDLNPIEEARGYWQLTQAPYHMNQEAIARKVGKRQSAVSETLALLKMAPEVVGNIERSIISRGHARVLAKITNVERQIALANQTAAEGWSVRELEARVKERSTAGKVGTPPSHPAPVSARPSDPFTDRWDALASGADLPLSWVAEHPRPNQWSITALAAEAQDAWALMAAFFKALGEAMTGVAARPPKAEPSILAAASQALAFREPQTPEEWAEVNALAKKGVRAVYEWVFGKDTPNLPPEGLLTWSKMGAPTPEEGVKLVLSLAKASAEGRPFEPLLKGRLPHS